MKKNTTKQLMSKTKSLTEVKPSINIANKYEESKIKLNLKNNPKPVLNLKNIRGVKDEEECKKNKKNLKNKKDKKNKIKMKMTKMKMEKMMPFEEMIDL